MKNLYLEIEKITINGNQEMIRTIFRYINKSNCIPQCRVIMDYSDAVTFLSELKYCNIISRKTFLRKREYLKNINTEKRIYKKDFNYLKYERIYKKPKPISFSDSRLKECMPSDEYEQMIKNYKYRIGRK